MSTTEIKELIASTKEILRKLVEESSELEKKQKNERAELNRKIKETIAKENNSCQQIQDYDISAFKRIIENLEREKENMDIQHDLDNHVIIQSTRTKFQKLGNVQDNPQTHCEEVDW